MEQLKQYFGLSRNGGASSQTVYNWYPCVNPSYLRLRKNAVYNRTALSLCVIREGCPEFAYLGSTAGFDRPTM